MGNDKMLDIDKYVFDLKEKDLPIEIWWKST
jgi:hypothetical protein